VSSGFGGQATLDSRDDRFHVNENYPYNGPKTKKILRRKLHDKIKKSRITIPRATSTVFILKSCGADRLVRQYSATEARL
jgi:hypothetical protein